jgi:hypothetical protein
MCAGWSAECVGCVGQVLASQKYHTSYFLLWHTGHHVACAQQMLDMPLQGFALAAPKGDAQGP